MAGTFLTKNNLPYFSSDGNEIEIKTEVSTGFEIVVDSKPVELKPNKYYNFGIVHDEVKITRFLSYSNNHVETYEGEFTIGSGGQVQFPAVVRWAEAPLFNEVGTTYQFSIKNGLGQYIKIQ